MAEPPLILVVEDEYLLQADVEQILTYGGFVTEVVSTGEEALTLFMRGGSMLYQALVTDVRLSGRLSGWDVAKRIREKDPTFPVIYATAYAAAEWRLQGVPNSVLVIKPFTRAQLVNAVSTLLNAGGPSPT